MQSKPIIILLCAILILMLALGIFLKNCHRDLGTSPSESTPNTGVSSQSTTEPVNEASGNTTDKTVDNTVGEIADLPTEQTGSQSSTQPTNNSAGETQETQPADTVPQGSIGVDTEWGGQPQQTGPSQPQSSSDPTQNTESTVPTETTPADTAPVETSPPETAPSDTKPDVELTDLTYAQYVRLSAADQQLYYQAFESDDAFFTWYRAAKSAYDEDKESSAVTGGGSIDIRDYIGK